MVSFNVVEPYAARGVPYPRLYPFRDVLLTVEHVIHTGKRKSGVCTQTLDHAVPNNCSKMSLRQVFARHRYCDHRQSARAYRRNHCGLAEDRAQSGSIAPPPPNQPTQNQYNGPDQRQRAASHQRDHDKDHRLQPKQGQNACFRATFCGVRIDQVQDEVEKGQYGNQ